MPSAFGAEPKPLTVALILLNALASFFATNFRHKVSGQNEDSHLLSKDALFASNSLSPLGFNPQRPHPSLTSNRILQCHLFREPFFTNTIPLSFVFLFLR